MVKVRLDISKALIDKINKAPAKLQKEISAEVGFAGERFTELAVKDCPGDTGFLSGSIRPEKTGMFTSEVTVGKEYGAYMEFGTKSRFVPQPGIDASVYKGKGTGDYFDFLDAILKWVERKGIAGRVSPKTGRRLKHTKSSQEKQLDAAQAIANSISRHGVKPHPFFFKQIPIVKKELEGHIANVLSDLYD